MIEVKMKRYYLILVLVCVAFWGFADDDAQKNKEISSLLKSTNESDMTVGANQIIDENRRNPSFVPLLINVLKTAKSSGAKCNAILALQVNRKYASSAVPVLILCLKDKDYRVVHNAIDALGVLAYSPQKVVPTLLKLNMNDSKIKWHVFRALGHFGRSANKAIPLLEENVNHGDAIYVGEAREALYKITGKEIETDMTPQFVYSTEREKIEVLPEKIEYIYIKQNKDDLSIKVSLNHLNFPDVNSFLLYLKQNIVKIKNKKYIIIASLNISHTAAPVIKLLIKNKIDVYGKDAILGGYFKYISIRTDGLDEPNEPLKTEASTQIKKIQ